ncbi:phytanoyl-CoA dioxygenase family protein [Sorangium sp. So ce834]|uniref:phytanoyl-CoA dioxygenase family protein n=1 Tax=Sorangium sp. So ce834 TaxID=3133321 RepID=UPI003F643B7B
MHTLRDPQPAVAPREPQPAAGLPPANRRLRLPDFTLGGALTAEQRDFLDAHGFIRFRGFAGRDAVRSLVEEVEAIDRRLVGEGRTHINGVPLILGTRKDGSRYIQRMVFASLFGERLRAFLRDPRFGAILDVAGPGYRIAERERDGLVINHYRREEGSTYQRLGWHTDSLRDVFYLERPRRYLNVGFYLDDSPLSKGGVRLIPSSHRQGLFQMITRKAYFLDHRPDPDEYALEAEAGDLTIHDGRIWHRVAQATATGDASQRRVMYLPLMCGPLKEKHENSPTPLYFRLKRLAGY